MSDKCGEYYHSWAREGRLYPYAGERCQCGLERFVSPEPSPEEIDARERRRRAERAVLEAYERNRLREEF